MGLPVAAQTCCDGVQGLSSSYGWWELIPLAEGPWEERVNMCRIGCSDLMKCAASGPAIGFGIKVQLCL